MRILVAHNAYRQRGGEDVVVDAECAMLEARGHTVMRYGRDNHEIRSGRAWQHALDSVWSQKTVREIGTCIQRFCPDVVHVHNTLPLISPAIYWAAARAGVPVVQTLHNYRLLCPQGMFLRNEEICTDCSGKLPWRGVMHRCYRDSTPQSAVVAGTLAVHRAIGTWKEKIDCYIALSDTCKSLFVAGGLPEHKIVVKPNFVPDTPPPRSDTKRTGFLFVGRLSPEKGVRVLLEAATRVRGLRIKIAGTGPLVGDVIAHTDVEWLGQLAPEDVRAAMRSALAVIVPSVWHETFGMVAIEAYACGTPVIASRIGSLAQIVDDGETGFLCTPGDPAALASAMQSLHADSSRAASLGRRAWGKYQKEFSEGANAEYLTNIYKMLVK